MAAGAPKAPRFCTVAARWLRPVVLQCLRPAVDRQNSDLENSSGRYRTQTAAAQRIRDLPACRYTCVMVEQSGQEMTWTVRRLSSPVGKAAEAKTRPGARASAGAEAEQRTRESCGPAPNPVAAPWTAVPPVVSVPAESPESQTAVVGLSSHNKYTYLCNPAIPEDSYLRHLHLSHLNCRAFSNAKFSEVAK